MKAIFKLLSICVIFFLIFFIIAGFMTYDSGKNASKDIFSSEDFLNKLSTQQLNKVKLPDGDIEKIINSFLSSYNKSKFTYSGCNVVIYPDNKAYIKLYLKDKATGFSTTFSSDLNFTYVNNIMNISISKAYIGKLPVPRGVLKLLLKQNVDRIKNSNSVVKDIDVSNLTIKLDLNSSLLKNQKILTIKNVSSESHNIILELSINMNIKLMP